jgi:hypothetical protein
MSPGDPYTLGRDEVRYSGANKEVARGLPGKGNLSPLNQPNYTAESWRSAMRPDGTVDRSKLVPYRTPTKEGAGKEYQTIVNRMMELEEKGLTKGFEYRQLEKRLKKLTNISPMATATASVVNKTGQEFGKEIAKSVVANQDKMYAYKENLRYLNDSQRLLDEGVITGVGAEWITGLGNVLQERLGIDMGDAVSNTEAFAASMANQAIAVMGSGKLGGGTGLSDNDLKFAQKMAASEITLSERAIRRIMSINRRAMRYQIKEHNRKAKKVNAWAKKNEIDLPYGVEVDMSDYKAYQSPLKPSPTVEDATSEDYRDAIIDKKIKERFGQ